MSPSVTHARVLTAILSGVALLATTACSVVTTDGAMREVTGRELRRDVQSGDEEATRDGTGTGRVLAANARREHDHHDKRR